jgi:uroporphyrinogen-III synthase
VRVGAASAPAEPLSLAGLVVGITADRRAREQAELLRRMGAQTVHGPTINTFTVGNQERVLAATAEIVARPPELLLATTGIGMRSWMVMAETAGVDAALLQTLGRARIVARGPKAAGAVRQMGLEVWHLEQTERLDGIVAWLVDRGVSGARIALQEYGNEAPWALAALREAGADVTSVPVYRWTLPPDRAPAIKLIQATIDGRVDVVTFTSSPAVGNMFAIASAAGLGDRVLPALRRVVVAAVGPVTAAAVAGMGINGCVAPDRGRLGLMVRRLSDSLLSSGHRLAVGHAEVIVRGSAVMSGGVRIELPDRERALLAVLLRRPGAVVSRRDLLDELWGTDGDPKTVDSAIARLRRRVAPVGLAIQAVPRRGYRLDTGGQAPAITEADR